MLFSWQKQSYVSIHAPAKGATMNSEYSGDCITSFNPRSREGSDLAGSCGNVVSQSVFQSTLPRRERLKALVCSVICLLFQSTLPRRERPFGITHPIKLIDVSIHAPAKGATQLRSFWASAALFQSTLPRRERL